MSCSPQQVCANESGKYDAIHVVGGGPGDLLDGCDFDRMQRVDGAAPLVNQGVGAYRCANGDGMKLSRNRGSAACVRIDSEHFPDVLLNHLRRMCSQFSRTNGAVLLRKVLTDERKRNRLRGKVV